MKRYALIFVIVSVLISCNTLSAQNLIKGTPITIQITEHISSKPGVNGTALVKEDVLSKQGEPLIKKGTPVYYQLDKKKARGVGKPGYINLKYICTTAIDGRIILLKGGNDTVGKDKRSLALGLGIGLGVTVLPGVGFSFLGIKGKNAEIPKGTIFKDVIVANNYQIDTTK